MSEVKNCPPTMGLPQKLLEMQKRVDKVVKDGKNTSDKYDFASDENVLDTFRPIMDELGLLLIPEITRAELHEGTTRSGTSRFMTELFFNMTWLDVESGESLSVPWYAQGVDLAGEKGVGKAATYAEKYFLLKFFHVSTKKDDPDNGTTTKGGDPKQRGTQAGRETVLYHRNAITQMLSEIYNGDSEKIKAGLVAMTKSEKRGFAGVDDVTKLSAAALPVAYARIKKAYEDRVGHAFEFKTEEET